jgi:chromosome segregation protein
MYLKRIELFGFKSFADRTELEFVPGITAVVGPNGSGKSNISDGIRWVLGEQSAKSLRGGKMEDIIFSGSDTRKPVNYSEISITLDNSSQTLPLEYNEVTVTRRVDRDGESDYAINKQSCRLKDITELFMDTGIGRESYSIIGQGRIDDILSTKSEDRRGIFEEASGIVKYKSRKREAEKKMLETEQNLIRIHDLVSELEDQVDPLQKQSEKALQFKSLKENLKQIEIGVYVHHIDRLYSSWTEENEKIRLLKTQQIDYSTALSTQDAELEKHRWEVQLIDDQLQQLSEELLKLSEEFEKCEGKGEVLRERKKNYDSNRLQVAQTIAMQEQRLQERNAEISKFSEQIELLDAQQYELNLSLQSEENNLHENIAGANPLDEEQLKARLLDILTKMSEARSSILFSEQQRQDLARRAQNSEQDMLLFQASLHEQNTKKMESEQKLLQLSTEIDDIRNQYLALVQKQQDLTSSQEVTENSIREYAQKLQGFTSRKDTIKEMMEDFEGFGQGVKEILKAKSSNQLKGIQGAIAELIQVPAHLETAIETSLGAALQNIIVDREADGRDAIAYLKQKQLGRATFLPLDVMKSRSISSQDILLLKSTSGFVGVADGLVQFNSKYKEIFANLLGQIIIAKSLEEANQLAAKIQYRYRVVTLEGDVVNPGGAMTGGSVNKKATSILSRQRQLEELNQSITQSQAQLVILQKNVDNVKKELNEMNHSLEQLRQDGEVKRIEEQQVRSQVESAQYEFTKVQESLAKKSQEHAELLEELQQLSEQKSQSEHVLALLLQDEENLQQATRDFEQSRKLGESVKEEIQTKLTDLKVNIATITQEKHSLIEQQRRLQDDLDVALMECAQSKEHLNSLDTDMQNQEQESIDQIELLNDLKIKKQNCSEEIDFKRADRKQRFENHQQEDQATRSLRSDLKKVEDQLHKLEVSATRLDVELETLLKKLSEEYELSYELAKSQYPLPDNIQSAEQQIKQIKKEITQLGDVNLGAIEEYTRVSERFNFLNEQKNDLIEAKTALYQIISEMDVEMSRKFKSTFDEIRAQFEHVFIKLFGGGHADLVLSDPSNLLDTGIEIIAQPPGKKIQNIQLLSGGEKALTAIALLFSILLVKPVPFCILDEVDAALDEANVARYANYLRDFSSKTQFIIVTHRKGTMEEADALYGVTMENDGVSKLVSVKLENYEESLVG